MEKFIEGLMTAVMFPLIVLKWVGWLACAIWLLCIGDWRVVVASLIAGWIGGKVLPLVNGIIMIPLLPFIGKANRSPVVAGTVTVIARVPTCALLIAWCVFCMLFVVSIKGMSSDTATPRLLMSYCMAIHTIWNLTADSNRGCGGGASNFFCVTLCALGYLFVVILLVCGVELSLFTAICILAGFLIVSIPVSVLEVVSMVRNEGDFVSNNARTYAVEEEHLK